MVTVEVGPEAEPRAERPPGSSRPASLTPVGRRAANVITGIVIAGVVIVLGVRCVGSPALLILIGAWLLALALHHGFPAISGPASWAAGMIAEIALLVAGSATAAIIWPHAHSRAGDLATLAVPAAVGLLALIGVLVARHRGGSDRADRVDLVPGRAGLLVVVHLVVFGVVDWIGTTGGRGVAWAMSGDARNHVLIVRQVLAAGGLTGTELHSYPAVVNAITALISGAGGRSGSAPGELMLHDARALAATYIIAVIAVASLFMAALLAFLPRGRMMSRRLPSGAVIVVLAAAATGGSGLVLATSLESGFLSAYGSLPVVIASVVLALRFADRPAPITVVLIALAAVVMFASWTPLVVVPGLLALVCLVLAARKRAELGPRRLVWLVTFVAVIAVLVTLAVVFVVERGPLERTFETPGAIAPMPPSILYVLILIAIAAMVADGRGRLIGPVVAIVGGSLMAAWIGLLPGNSQDAYYAVKTVYLTAACFVWLAFVPVLALVLSRAKVVGEPTWAQVTLRSIVLPLAASFVALTAIGYAPSLQNSVHRAKVGWAAPSAATVVQTAALADAGRPFLFWDWSGSSAEDQAGNFWAVMIWATNAAGDAEAPPPGLPDGAITWAYDETGQVADLCTIGRAYPRLTVMTSVASRAAQLAAACPDAEFHVVLNVPAE